MPVGGPVSRGTGPAACPSGCTRRRRDRRVVERSSTDVCQPPKAGEHDGRRNRRRRATGSSGMAIARRDGWVAVHRRRRGVRDGGAVGRCGRRSRRRVRAVTVAGAGVRHRRLGAADRRPPVHPWRGPLPRCVPDGVIAAVSAIGHRRTTEALACLLRRRIRIGCQGSVRLSGALAQAAARRARAVSVHGRSIILRPARFGCGVCERDRGSAREQLAQSPVRGDRRGGRDRGGVVGTGCPAGGGQSILEGRGVRRLRHGGGTAGRVRRRGPGQAARLHLRPGPSINDVAADIIAKRLSLRDLRDAGEDLR
jgi:hypothetical protein